MRDLLIRNSIVYRRFHRLVYVVAAGFLWLSAVEAAEAPQVVVSQKAIHSLVAGLMDGVGDPELMISEGSPLEFLPTPAQKAQLSEADLVIWVGPELEPGLADALKSRATGKEPLELLAAPELKILPSRSGDGRDPFFWLDTRNMLILLDLLTARLTQLDPVRAHRYQDNRLKALADLSQIDRKLEFGYKDVSARPLFLYHDTQQYFEQAYAMKVAGIAAALPNNEPDAENFLQVRQSLAEAASPCLLTEAAFRAPHMELIDAPNVRLSELDSLGIRLAPGPGLYAALMSDHYRTIRECLNPESGAEGIADIPNPGVELYSHLIQGKYLLMNHFGETVSNLDFAGRYQLLYFGYTFCPDICPTSLSSMAQAMKMLGPKAERIQPLFITVDPARDTLDVLRRYTGYFHPRLLGLTGPEAMIARTAEQFRVRYEKVESSDRMPDKYAMDHTASLFLLGPDSEFVAKFAHGMSPRDLAERLDELIPE